MGLTGGIADVGSLYDSLRGIDNNKTDDSILDKYDEVRRRIWHEVIDPISTENMQRLFQYQNADEFVDKDPLYRLVREMQNPDKKLEKGGPPNASVTVSQRWLWS